MKAFAIVCILSLFVVSAFGQGARNTDLQENSTKVDVSANNADVKRIDIPAGLNPLSTSRAFAIDVRNQREVKINLGTGTVTQFGIVTGGRPFYAGDFDGSGTWYAVSTPDTLYTVDTTSGAFTVLGNIAGIPAGSNTSGITWDYSSSTMYLCNLSGGVATLYTLDLGTRVATPIGPILTGTLIDIAASNGGQLYGIRFAAAAGISDSLVSINKTTGTGTTVGPLNVDVNFAHGLDFDPVTDSLFYPGYIGGGVNNLYRINTQTGNAELVFALAAGEYDAFSVVGAPPSPPAEHFADHVTSALRASVTNEGNIGFLNAFPPTGPGSGFMFNPVSTAGQRLFEGAVMIGDDSSHVSDAARDEAQVFDADFQFLANFDSSQSSGSRRVLVTSYDDSPAEAPLGITVTQKSISKDSAGVNSMVLMQLDLENTTATAYSNLTVGGFFDWDVDPATANDNGRYIIDSMNTIPGVFGGNPFPFHSIEMHQGVSPNSWVGVVPLNENRFRAARVAVSANEIYPPHMTDGDKWRYMTELRATDPYGDGGTAADHGMFFGIGPYSLNGMATKRVGFAMVAGSSLQNFINAARAAQAMWVSLGNSINVVTDVREPDLGIPVAFDLSQNYPNPFNPSTSVRYQLPTQSNVTLKIFNILGQEVASLVDGVREAGVFTATWDGHNKAGEQVGSGVYFYRLEANSADGKSFTSMKKMLLLK